MVQSNTTGFGDTDDIPIDGVTIDSRTVEPGDLFVPIVADRDGHDFIAAAVAAGAVAALVQADHQSQASELTDPDGRPVPAVVVTNTDQALLLLGKAARNRLNAQVVGVTGSVGKTSVKDLLTAIGSAHTTTHSNLASFNNELGVPLTLLGAPLDAGIVIIEMGARDVGHIELLCGIARPTIGIVTAVAAVHTEIFGTIAQVAQAKGELVEQLPEEGTAVLNADDPLVMAMASRSGAKNILSYGFGAADVRVSDVVVGPNLRPTFTLTTPVGSASLQLGVAGAHMAGNAAAAAAGAIAAGVPFDAIQEGLVSPVLSPHRMDLFTTDAGTAIINDAYNANPTSMRAGIDALIALEARRHIAVLGVMGELGSSEAEDHVAIAGYARERGVEVIAVNAPLYGERCSHAVDVDTALQILGELGHNDAVLVKGSRVAGLEKFVDRVVGRDGLRNG
ncbi:MAG: UDP-N-acetylmuramoyl-tripeptide--D-alanyl-D-alanine ligase [Acidimicrobiales bacterium]|nr:UDP-N-acetylmuramoyl-tripeptide--D-alanyl-D-alanine ligase [Acidimicrobiales bacterium]